MPGGPAAEAYLDFGRMSPDVLIERESERAWLEAVLAETLAGRGSLVLLSGEAGVGKTRFAEEVLGSADVRFLRGTPGPGALAYGPVISALRGFERSVPGALSQCGPLRSHLALLLPELGEAVRESDRATLVEAIRCALATVAAEQPAVMLLDDLQWSDDATLELLATLAVPLRELPMLVVGAYRSDEIPRSHPMRRLRHDLRRNRLLCELALEPLTAQGTAELTGRVLGVSPSARLAGTLHDRTGGNPFFVEELAGALEHGGRLRPGKAGLDLALDVDVPLPQTIRDAVVLRAGDLSEEARATAEAASVAGTRFDLELVAAVGCEAGLEELLACGLIVELERGRAAFRHPLARDAIYEDVPWLRRRALHRRLAGSPRGPRRRSGRGGRPLGGGARRIPCARGARAGGRGAVLGSRLSRCGAAWPPGARHVAPGGARRRADRAARAPRAHGGARRRAGRGDPRAARGRGGTALGGRRPRTR